MTKTDTLNWDTVFATPISNINKTIVSPNRFNYKLGDDGNISGKFGKWEIVPGGGGSILHFRIPFENVEGYNSDLGTYSWEKSSVVVALKNEFFTS
ncbi:TULIP family P47-like protein (plasmid) [Bacillus toyonensis]